MKKYTIREIKETDINQILDIYTPYILNTPITFEYTVPTLEDFNARTKKIMGKYPYIVCEIEKEIVGYAYAGPYKNRAAYDYSAELSIYIKEGYKSKGIGKKLYSALIDILKFQNYQILYACITIHKTLKSSLFHEQLGFKQIGMFEKSGFKEGKWYDTAWYSLKTGNFETKPKPIIRTENLDKTELKNILNKYEYELNQELFR